MSTSKAWKEAEKKVAKVTGGIRRGGCRRDQEDVEHPVFGIEVKHSKNFPKWIIDILDEAKVHSPTKIPIGVLKPKHRPFEIVLIKLSDFQDLFGKIKLD